MKKESTHIRIDTELKEELQAMAGSGETVNDVISRLIAGTPAGNRDFNITRHLSPVKLTGSYRPASAYCNPGNRIEYG